MADEETEELAVRTGCAMAAGALAALFAIIGAVAWLGGESSFWVAFSPVAYLTFGALLTPLSKALLKEIENDMEPMALLSPILWPLFFGFGAPLLLFKKIFTSLMR